MCFCGCKCLHNVNKPTPRNLCLSGDKAINSNIEYPWVFDQWGGPVTPPTIRIHGTYVTACFHVVIQRSNANTALLTLMGAKDVPMEAVFRRATTPASCKA